MPGILMPDWHSTLGCDVNTHYTPQILPILNCSKPRGRSLLKGRLSEILVFHWLTFCSRINIIKSISAYKTHISYSVLCSLNLPCTTDESYKKTAGNRML